MPEINILAVLTGTVLSFVLGGIWYSKLLFETTWVRESGADMEQAGHPAKVFGTAFVFTLIGAFVFAWVLGPAPAVGDAVITGVVVGAGIVAASFGVNYQFAQRSFTLLAIDGGYHTAQFALIGLVLGLWP